MLCPGSVFLSKGIPATTSDYAEEGTWAHELAARWLKGDRAIIPEDIELKDALVTYTSNIAELSKGATVTWVEQPLDLSSVLDIEEEKGTADFMVLLPKGILQVHDLKYGKGVSVDAFDNWQLILYGLGALEIAELIDDVNEVQLYIHQPRLHSEPSRHVMTVAQIKLCGVELRKGAQRAKRMYDGDLPPEYNPGEKQCRFCPAKAKCKALLALTTKAMLGEVEDIPPAEQLGEKIEASIANLAAQPVETRAAIVLNLDLILDWAKAVKELAMAEMLRGVKYPGLKLVEGRAGNRKWTSEEEATAKLKSMRLKVEEMYNLELISPTQAEKVLKDSKRRWNSLQELITRSEPKPAIVPVSDKRPELTVTAVIDEVENLEPAQEIDLCA